MGNFKKDVAWTGPVDHDLLAFNCILIRTKVQVHHNCYAKISQRLPFYQENNTALGLVAKQFLMNEKQSNADIVENYPCCVSPVEDLKKGIQFWNEIVLMVKEL